jgi:hypothetical protein
MIEHAWREVLDQNVGLCNELGGDVLSDAIRKIEGKTPLVEVGALPHGAALPPILSEFWQ